MTNEKFIPVITVDGPSGAGKGTLSAKLTQALGFHFLDSGALYRIVGLAAERNQQDFNDESALAELAIGLNFSFIPDESGIRIFLDGSDITDDVRLETTGNLASLVAAKPAVRATLLQRQRSFLKPPGLIADGRDMGTVVFPNANVKFFLTASPEERAKRRYFQLKEKGHDVSIARLAAEIRERDERDTLRAESPLVPAKDAILLDSSNLDINQVFEFALKQVKNAGF